MQSLSTYKLDSYFKYKMKKKMGNDKWPIYPLKIKQFSSCAKDLKCKIMNYTKMNIKNKL